MFTPSKYVSSIYRKGKLASSKRVKCDVSLMKELLIFNDPSPTSDGIADAGEELF